MSERTNIPMSSRWQLEDLMESDQVWEEKYLQLQNEVHVLSKFQGKLHDKQQLLQYFQEEERLSERLNKLSAYAKMRLDEDARSSHYTAMCGKIDSLCTKFASASAYVTPELTALPKEQLNAFMHDPKFSAYDYFFARLIAQKSHVLTVDQEVLLSNVSEVTSGYSDIFEILDNADLNLPTIRIGKKSVQLTHATYSVLMQDEDREIRKKTYENYYQAYKKVSHVLAATYAANVKKDWFYAKTRNYQSCMQKALQREDVDVSVYQNLLNSVSGALPTLHRYIKYKKDALNLNQFYMYDMYMPTVTNSELKLDYDQAYQMVIQGLQVLGDEYGGLLQTAHDQRWIDVYENAGKRSGAYSMGIYGCHPYVLLNYQPTTHNVFTIAHEMGHALHSHYSYQAQPIAKGDYVIFVAEVASTVNEVLLLRHIARTTKDKQLQKYLLYYLLEMLRTTLFRQTQFAEFEVIAHNCVEKGEVLTLDALNQMYLELNQKYYGTVVEADDCIAYEWSRIPHFYRAFYVYKYATGIISAVSIADRIEQLGKPAVDDYLRFLSSGGSAAPVELLKIAGVDLTTAAPFERANQVFEHTLQQLIALK